MLAGGDFSRLDIHFFLGILKTLLFYLSGTYLKLLLESF